MRKVKGNVTNIETTVFPRGVINTNAPYFSWPSVPDAVHYLLWVNDYGIPNIGGKINSFYTSSEANCCLNNDQYCRVYPNVKFPPQGEQWWVTAFFADDHSNQRVVNGLLFSIE